ncbi:MAG: stage V sporulation protein AA [Lachnospiraceae bacterium]|nr:stage V sporulation protein AA [Lachnospiraceae bacterium]
MSETVYLKLDRISRVREKNVQLHQVGKLWCSNKELESRCGQLKILEIKADTDQRYVMSVLKVIELLSQMDESIRVSNLGEIDFVIDYQPGPGSSKWWNWAKTLFVCVTMFIGGAFAIMTFNNDACVSEIFQQMYLSVTGTEADGVTVLDVAYSIGLPLGILVFFNHFSKISFSKDPTPIEVQMRGYESEVNDTLVQNASREESGIDVS